MPQGHISTARILVVEDRPAERRMFCRNLEFAGYQVSAADSAALARKMLAAGDFHLVLSDLGLETEDAGLDLLRWVRTDPAKNGMAFITITGRVQTSEELRQIREMGATDCLPKPIEMDILKERLRSALENPRPAVRAGGGVPARVPAGDSGPATPADTVNSIRDETRMVLVVDDDDGYRPLVEMGFREAGFKTSTAATGQKGLELARRLHPAAIILDFNLPDSSGLEIVQELKNDPETSDILILVLTGNDAKGRQVVCLNDGADGYLVKGSCSVEAVVAHARALLRVQQAPLAIRLRIGPVVIDLENQRVLIDDVPTKKLTLKEFDLLALLMRRSPQIVGWDVLGERIGDTPALGAFKAKESLRVHLSHLKHKLGPRGSVCLKTHKQEGLQFQPPIEEPPEKPPFSQR